MIHDLWLVLTRRLTQRKLDRCDALCLRLARDLQHKEILIKALTLTKGRDYDVAIEGVEVVGSETKH
jgi:hypothetical protein